MECIISGSIPIKRTTIILFHKFTNHEAMIIIPSPIIQNLSILWTPLVHVLLGVLIAEVDLYTKVELVWAQESAL